MVAKGSSRLWFQWFLAVNLYPPMSKGSHSFFSKLFTFRGRISRSQFFYGLLFKWALMFLVGNLVVFLYQRTNEFDALTIIFGLPLFVFICWINLSLHARRLHDMGHSGFWLLFYLIPVLNYLFGIVILIMCLVCEGLKHENKYGVKPTRIF